LGSDAKQVDPVADETEKAKDIYRQIAATAECVPVCSKRSRPDGEPVLVEVSAPADQELQALLHKIITWLMKLLTRRGVLVEAEEGASRSLADADADADADAASDEACAHARPVRISWARLLKRVFEIDL